MTVQTPRHIAIVRAKNGKPSLQVTGEDHSKKTLHSMYDPETEAVNIVNAFESQGKGIIVVLGLGLGYHVAELKRQYPEATIMVVDALENMKSYASNYGPELDSDITLLAGLSSSEAISEIARTQMNMGIVPLSVLTLSSAVSSFPEYYRPIIDSLNNITSVKLWDRLRYSKFKGEKANILLIDSGYFLLKEIETAIHDLGHKVMKVQINEYTKENALLSIVIKAVLDFKPDFLLTVNHLGFDEDGVLTSFFDSINLPVASWYVDSPSLIIKEFDKNVSPAVSLFLWDKSYIKEMESIGFESISYLPMAADETIFRSLQGKKHVKKITQYTCDVGFVGNSLVDTTADKMKKIPDDYHDFIEKAAILLSTTRSSLQEALEGVDDYKHVTVEIDNKQMRGSVEAAALWRAALLYRLSCLKELDVFHASIYGDHGWKTLLKGNFLINEPLNYYKELPYFYNACKVNFNATHLQMSEAVNQRVFDVPACGAFILTDHQEALHDLFDVGKDIVTYKNKEEITDLVSFYLKHPDKRKQVGRKGRERILENHTYKHRLNTMIECMRERYA